MELEAGSVVGILALVALALAFPAAGRMGAGGFGVFGLAIALFGGSLLYWFWAGAGLSLLARLAGGQGTVESTLGALAQAAWPLLLLSPAIALRDWDVIPGAGVLVVCVLVWSLALGIVFVRRVQGLTWGKTAVSWIVLGAVTLMTGILGLIASMIWAVLLT
jgi:hypothetical protein